MSDLRDRIDRALHRSAVSARRVGASIVEVGRARYSGRTLDRVARVSPEPAPALIEETAPTLSVGNLEAPVDGTTVAGPFLNVSGWCTLDPVARVEVSVDGEVAIARQMAIPRPDVALVRASPHAGFSGFEHTVEVSDHAPGRELAIRVEAVGDDGSRQPLGDAVVTLANLPTDERGASMARLDTGAAGTAEDDRSYLAALRARTDEVTTRHRPAPSGVRLFVVTHDLGLGGGQLYLHELLLRLLDHSDLRCLVVTPADGPLRRELVARGAEVHIAGQYPTEPMAHESLVRELAFLAGAFQATAVLANTVGADCGVELASRLGVPALWAIHESYAPEHFVLAAYGGAAHPSTTARLERSLAVASAVIFEADHTLALFRPYGDPRRFVRVDYGISLEAVDGFRAADDRTARRTELGWTEESVVLLCIGTLEPRKAQASLLRAFARVVGDHPEAVLVLVGERGDAYSAQVRAYAERLGLGDRVRIEPVTPDCYGWYAAADVFVLTSDLESLPRSVLESMAFGLPAVVGDVFGLHDLVEDGVTGIHVAPRDLLALEQGLRRVLRMTPEARRAMGALGCEEIRGHHDGRGYAIVYRKLIDGLASDPAAFAEDLL